MSEILEILSVNAGNIYFYGLEQPEVRYIFMSFIQLHIVLCSQMKKRDISHVWKPWDENNEKKLGSQFAGSSCIQHVLIF